MRGHVRKHGAGWSIVYELPRDADGKRKQKWLSGFPTKKEAERRLIEILRQADSGVYVDPGNLDVAGLMDQWLKHMEGQVSRKTLDGYNGLVSAYIVPGLGAIKLAKLRPLHVDRFLKELRSVRTGKPLAGKTRLHIYRVLSEALKRGVRWQLIERNPCEDVDAPRKNKPQIETLDAEQLQTVLEASRGGDWETAVLILATTGMRRGEVLALRWSDIDLDAAALFVRRTLEDVNGKVAFKEPKTDRSRRKVALAEVTVNALRTWRQRQAEFCMATGLRPTDDLVFHRVDGTPMLPSSLTQYFSRLTARLGLDVHLHALRHTHATQLLRAGVNVKVVSERLGHSSVAFTMDTYADVLDDMQDAAADAIDALFQTSEK